MFLNRKAALAAILISVFAAYHKCHAQQTDTKIQKATLDEIDDKFSAESRKAAADANKSLQQNYRSFLLEDKNVVQPEKVVDESKLPKSQRRGLAESTSATYKAPDEISSVNGLLDTTLTVQKAHNRIGDDPVYLRSYNGQLVGPTLRLKPGDTLKIRLDNTLQEEPVPSDHSNTLHGFNTTNLHTHGLHVSPSGISDNILLSVAPQTSQQYEISIPADHPGGTFWYHAHKHGSTAAQLASGMAGALIISGDMDEVPEIESATERVLMFQQISYLYKDCFENSDEMQTCFDLPEGVIEEQYVDFIFGPRTWDRLGRYTTVNGVELPVIRVKPGSVERWRMVHAGVRERLELKLEKSGSTDGDAEILSMHEIAVDGLPLGTLAERETIEMWPGYRSDVLVKFPNEPGTEFLLVDERSPAAMSLNGASESRKYIARIIVEGAEASQELPESSQLAGFRLPSIEPDEVTGSQNVTYGILRVPGGVRFTVDGTAYDPHAEPRKLVLGDVDDWTLKSQGQVGPVSHPFHIHVNPFEVYSILDDSDVEQLSEPVWRDTIVLPGGWTVKCRSRYRVFTGTFVNHCHILDHEDQGMMELVEIVEPGVAGAARESLMPVVRPARPYAAADWKLPRADGTFLTHQQLRGKPVVLLFFQGSGCLHCAEQLAEFAARAEDFASAGATVVAISTDSLEDLKAAQQTYDSKFPIVADPRKTVFSDYGCVAGDALHGTFIMDAHGRVCWQCVSARPYMDVDTVLAEIRSLDSSAVAAR